MDDLKIWMRWTFLGPEGLRAGWRTVGFGVGFVGVTVIGALFAIGAGMGLQALGAPMVTLVLATTWAMNLPLLAWNALAGWVLEWRSPKASGMGGPIGRSAGEYVAGVVVGALMNSAVLAVLWAMAAGEVAEIEVAIAPATFSARDLAEMVAWIGVFVVAAAWEEVLFRGYGFALTARSLGRLAHLVVQRVSPGTDADTSHRLTQHLARVPLVLVSSLAFAALHMGNPGNEGAWLPFLNTFLAGIWLAVAVLRTRALWFAFGLHFGWNAVMGSFWGIEVSGMAVPSVLETKLTGAAWLTGGSYGLEGSVFTAVVLVLGTLLAGFWPARKGDEAMPGLRLDTVEPPPFAQRLAGETV